MFAELSTAIAVTLTVMGGALGIPTSIASIVIFTHRSMRTHSINILLAGLSFTDLAVVITAIPAFGLFKIVGQYRMSDLVVYIIYPIAMMAQATPLVITAIPGLFKIVGQYRMSGLVVYIIYPIAMMAQASSVWILVLITAERFAAVCYPLTAKRRFTPRRAVIALFLIYSASFVYNVVRWWEYDLHWLPVDHSVTHPPSAGSVGLEEGSHAAAAATIINSVNNRSELTVPLVSSTIKHATTAWRPTAMENLKRSKVYMLLYFTAMYLIFIAVIPFIVLVTLNSYIIHAIRVANKARAALSSSQVTEHKTTQMMITIIVLFAMCNTLPFVLNLVECLMPNFYEYNVTIAPWCSWDFEMEANATDHQGSAHWAENDPACGNVHADSILDHSPNTTFVIVTNEISYVFLDITNFLVVFNSSWSWLVYWYFSQRYRTLFRMLLRCRLYRKESLMRHMGTSDYGNHMVTYGTRHDNGMSTAVSHTNNHVGYIFNNNSSRRSRLGRGCKGRAGGSPGTSVTNGNRWAKGPRRSDAGCSDARLFPFRSAVRLKTMSVRKPARRTQADVDGPANESLLPQKSQRSQSVVPGSASDCGRPKNALSPAVSSLKETTAGLQTPPTTTSNMSLAVPTPPTVPRTRVLPKGQTGSKNVRIQVSNSENVICDRPTNVPMKPVAGRGGSMPPGAMKSQTSVTPPNRANQLNGYSQEISAAVLENDCSNTCCKSENDVSYSVTTCASTNSDDYNGIDDNINSDSSNRISGSHNGTNNGENRLVNGSNTGINGRNNSHNTSDGNNNQEINWTDSSSSGSNENKNSKSFSNVKKSNSNNTSEKNDADIIKNGDNCSTGSNL